MDKKFVVIDANGLIHRAFHALPPMTTKEGAPVNAAYGFFSMLLNLIDTYSPGYMAAAFDLEKDTFRTALYADYKATRQKTPDDLISQFPLIRDALHKLGIKVVGLSGYEADDIAGTLVSKAEEQGADVLVFTGDRDYLQLISDKTQVLLTKKGVSETEVYDKAHLKEVYGLEPDQIVDLKALMGDASDNIPGVRGVGEKTALKLIQEFGTVEELYRRMEELPQNKMKEKIAEGKDSAFLSKTLAKIDCCVPIESELSAYAFSGLKDDQLYEVLSSFEFGSILKRRGLQKTERQERPVLVLQTKEDAEAAVKALSACSALAACREGGALYLAAKEGKEYSVLEVASLFSAGVDAAGMLQALRGVLEDESKGKVLYDLKAFLHLFKSLGITLKGSAFDVMLAEYVLDPTKRDFSLANLKETYGAAGMAASLFEIEEKQKKKIAKNGLKQVFYEIETPLSTVLFEMEEEGFRIDVARLEELARTYGEQISALEEEICLLAGEKFNIASTRQLGTILFEKLGLPVVKKTKTGYSTDVEVLEKLQGRHEIVDHIMEYRKMTKLKSTYLDGFRPLIDPKTGRVHTTFSQTATATGRISSLEPNLQNIPIRTEFSAHIRELFIPLREEDYIVAADYSQIELRVLAHISGDAHMCDAFNKDEDIHSRTAAEVFGVPQELVTPEMRGSAKAVNFGIVYGISDFGLSRNLGIPRYKAEEYINRYLDEFTGVRKYMRDIVALAEKEGYVKTLYGRVRYIGELKSSNFNSRSFGQRVALNTPIQGTAADIIKIAMIRVYEELKKRGLGARLISQVHDELIVNAPPEEVGEVTEILKNVMENVVKLSVPLKANVSCGKNWAEAK